MDRVDEQEPSCDPSRTSQDAPFSSDESDLLSYLASLPEPTDSPAPEPTLGELLEEAESAGGSDRIAAEARRLDPGPATAQMLAVIYPARLGSAGLLDAACAAERLASWTQAVQHRYVAAFARPGVAAPLEQVVDYASSPGQPLHRTEGRGRADGETDRDLASSRSVMHGRPQLEKAAITASAVKVAAAELSAALLVSPINASRRVAQAVDFTDDLPVTLRALRDGAIDRGRAMVIADRTQNLPTDLRRRVESRIVPKATGRTAGQIRGIADRAVIAADPAAARKRQEAARARRGISIRPGEDGMSVFRADLSADKSVTAFSVIDQIATANARNSSEKRPIGAIRADVFADIFDQLANHGSVHLFVPSSAAAPCPHRLSATSADGRSSAGDDATPAESTPTQATAANLLPAPTLRSAGCSRNAAQGDEPPGATGTPKPGQNPNEIATGALTPSAPPAARDAAQSTEDVATERVCADPRPSPGRTVAAGGASAAVSATTVGKPLDGTNDGAAPPCACHRPGVASTTDFWGLGTHQGRTTGLSVTIAATTLAGLDDLPGELDGHGPIPADMARALAASAATITAVAVNPACGTALDLGRTTYRPRLAQRDRVVQRDRTCRFVGCRQPAWRCQIDHSDEFCPGQSDGGVTCPCNLACVCKFHHDLKTFNLWDATHHPDDSITWISPTKRRYTSQPREWLTGMVDDSDQVSTEPTAEETNGGLSDGQTPAQRENPPPF